MRKTLSLNIRKSPLAKRRSRKRAIDWGSRRATRAVVAPCSRVVVLIDTCHVEFMRTEECANREGVRSVDGTGAWLTTVDPGR